MTTLLALWDAVKEFKDYLKGALEDPSTKDTVSKVSNDALTSLISKRNLTTVADNAVSNASTFGIGIGLAFLGNYLATKKRNSPAARAIARILGTDVNAINRDFVLEKLKDENYFMEVHEKIMHVIKTRSIDDFALYLGLTSGEAWEVFRQLKDYVLDNEVIDMIAQISNAITQSEITISDEIKSLKVTFNEQLKNEGERFEKNFRNYMNELRIADSNFDLVTAATEFGKGDRDCWKEGYFENEDVKSGYDARRPITDEIISSIDKNTGTMFYGDAYHGKSVILKRVMFEEIERGYSILFSEDIQTGNENHLKTLLESISDNFQNLLVIADNVHKTGSEVLFKVFNKLTAKDSDHIRFLFAARENELKKTKPEISRALKNVQELKVGFDINDAALFVQQAINVSFKIKVPENYARTHAEDLYKFSKGDPFMFVCGIMYNISGSAENKKTYDDFIVIDIEKKIERIEEHEELWKPALLCSFMGMFGIPIKPDTYPKLFKCCGVYEDEIISLERESFLFKNGGYKMRHEMWALIFLVHVYKKKFNNNSVSFDHKYGIKNMVRCILNSIGINYLIDTLVRCVLLYEQKDGRYKPICDIVTYDYVVPSDKYVPPAHITSEDLAKLFVFGLGTIYHYSRKDYANSLKYYDRAIQIDPNNAAAWYSKGLDLDSLGKSNEAIQAFDKAIEINPNIAEIAWSAKGLALDRLGKSNEAIQAFDKAIEIKTDYADAWNNKGVALISLGNYNEAIQAFDRAIQIDPNYADAWYNKGVNLGKHLGKSNEAIQAFDKAIEINPNNANAWFNKGVALDSLGKSDEAIACYDKAIQIDPNNVDAWNNKGNVLKNLGKSDEAIACYDKAIEINPNNANAWYNKGVALGKHLGNYNEAIQAFDKAIEIKTDYADAWYSKGLALISLGNYNEAIQAFDKAIEIKTDYAEIAWSVKGLALIRLGKSNEAIQAFDKALEIKTDYADAWYSKGLAFDSLGNYNEAIQAFDKAIEIKTDYADAWYSKGLAFDRLGKSNEAIQAFDKALEIDANHVDAWNNKGVSLYDLGKYDEAIKSYDKAIEINPDSLDIKANLGEALLITRDYSKSERLAKEVSDKTDNKILVYIMHLLIVCSLYMRGSTAEGRKQTLDLLNYFESIPTDFEYDWSFDNLKENINYDSRLSKKEKEILSLLISLPQTKAADYRLKYVSEIRNLIGK